MWTAGLYNQAASVCGLLQTTLTDEATAEAARRIITQIAESMETDALAASDGDDCVAHSKLAPQRRREIAATKQVLLDAGVLLLLKALDQDNGASCAVPAQASG